MNGLMTLYADPVMVFDCGSLQKKRRISRCKCGCLRPVPVHEKGHVAALVAADQGGVAELATGRVHHPRDAHGPAIDAADVQEMAMKRWCPIP